MTDHSSPEKSPWGLESTDYLLYFRWSVYVDFLALLFQMNQTICQVSKTKHNTQQHDIKNAPVMSEEAMQKQRPIRVTPEAIYSQLAAEMHMTRTACAYG